MDEKKGGDQLVKAVFHHQAAIIADMIFCGFYIFSIGHILDIVADVGTFLSVMTMVLFVGIFASVQFLVYYLIRSDYSSRRELSGKNSFIKGI